MAKINKSNDHSYTHVARSTSLSDEAFLALRAEKRPGESDSDVVLRLLREVRIKRKDPKRFLKAVHEPLVPPEAYDAFLDGMREADRRRLPG